MKSFREIGKPMRKSDGREKVTGSAVFAADIFLPNMLYGKILRSPHAHARISYIDTSKAERKIGVKAVVSAKDTLDVMFGHFIRDERVLAKDKVRYVGDPVAAVAAVDKDTAEEALDLIDVEYEELHAVLDTYEAMKDNSPIIHEQLSEYETTFEAENYGNICSIARVRYGDVNKGFKESDHIFEDTFKTPQQYQCYLEPHAAVAYLDGNIVVIYTSTQIPFRLANQVSRILGIPLNRIRIITTKIGAGFGGKESRVDGICALLAMKSGRPVKIALTTEEDFETATPRHSSIIKLKTGVTKTGKLNAIEAMMVFDTGAYSDHGPGVVSYAAQTIGGRYNIPNIKVDSFCVYTNKTACGAFRGYGAPQATFACETQLDRIARDLQIDPLELRLMNAVDEGDICQTTGQPFYSVAFKETLKKAAESIKWGTSESPSMKNKKIGKGLAGLVHVTGLLGSSAVVNIYQDGTVQILTGAVDIGTGSDTALIQIAAEILGVRNEHISIVTGDTQRTPYDFGSVASRVVYSAGKAVILAAEDAKKQLLKNAASILEASVDKLVIEDEKVYVSGTPERRISLSEVARYAYSFGTGPIVGRGTFLPDVKPLDPQINKGFPFGAYPFPNFVHGAVGVEIAVDIETGEIEVIKIATVQDVGKAINPQNVRGQLIGGAVQGVGYALYEKMLYDQKGKLLNNSYRDYRIPRSISIPEVDAQWVESNDPKGPFGAKGVGEPPMIAIAPAIANAIYDAIGVWIKEIPVEPEAVLKALKINI
jgi:carbon-monoxide dehydrogenase large subunit